MNKMDLLIDEVCEELFALEPDELLRLIQKHTDGNIANALLELNTLDIGEMEADITEDVYNEFYVNYDLSGPPIELNLLGLTEFINFHPDDPLFLNQYKAQYKIFSEEIRMEDKQEYHAQEKYIVGEVIDNRDFRQIVGSKTFEEEEVCLIAA